MLLFLSSLLSMIYYYYDTIVLLLSVEVSVSRLLDLDTVYDVRG